MVKQHCFSRDMGTRTLGEGDEEATGYEIWWRWSRSRAGRYTAPAHRWLNFLGGGYRRGRRRIAAKPEEVERLPGGEHGLCGWGEVGGGKGEWKGGEGGSGLRTGARRSHRKEERWAGAGWDRMALALWPTGLLRGEMWVATLGHCSVLQSLESSVPPDPGCPL